jgi:hypothetical protein
MSAPANNLRFAPLVRVSTEKQSEKGESLRTQVSQIKLYVQSLGGRIQNNCWQYCGQEHATPEQERKNLTGYYRMRKRNYLMLL